MQRNNAQIISSTMPKLSNTLRITNERQKSARIIYTSEEIAEQVEEYLAKGGTITQLPSGVRRDV